VEDIPSSVAERWAAIIVQLKMRAQFLESDVAKLEAYAVFEKLKDISK
jgi:hypothetical protein